MSVSVEQLRTGATIVLAVVGIWVLTVVSGPLNRYEVLVIGGMFVALLAIFTIPFTRGFFALVDPGEELSVALTRIAATVTVLALRTPPVARTFRRATDAGGS